MDSIGDFLVGIGSGISAAFQKLSQGVDLILLRRTNEENIETANNSLNKVRKDMMTTAFAFRNPANAGLKDFEGKQLIESELDEKKDKKEDEKPKQEKPKEGDADNVEGEKGNFNGENLEIPNVGDVEGNININGKNYKVLESVLDERDEILKIVVAIATAKKEKESSNDKSIKGSS